MEKETIYKHPNIVITYSEKGNYLHEVWNGITTDDVFNGIIEEISELLRDKKADGVIFDAREHKGFSPKSQEFAAKKMAEYASFHGSLKQAIIDPKDVFSKFSVDSYVKLLGAISSKVETRFFFREKEAIEWLENVD